MRAMGEGHGRELVLPPSLALLFVPRAMDETVDPQKKRTMSYGRISKEAILSYELLKRGLE